MIINDEFIINNIDSFELLGTSSNKVYRFSAGGGRYILKVNNLSGKLSSFWWGIQELFDSGFDTQRENIEEILSLLNNPHIQPASFVSKSHKSKFQIFREAEGISYEPDEFPDSDAICRQLGLFIGFIHSTEYDYFGHPKSHFRSGFREKMIKIMSQIIKEYWTDSKAVETHFNRICEYDISPVSYGLIMPDISANQFVFGDNMNSINAIVDFDAYVIGPREWELAVIELCLKDGKAFTEGYEHYRPFPDINIHRDFYRFYMYLCNPWESPDLDSYMGDNILFAD